MSQSASALSTDWAGVNAGDVFSESASAQAAQFAAMAAGGVSVVRADAPWELVEPNPPSNGQHTYSFAGGDTNVGAMAAHNLRWNPVIDYSTTWSTSQPGNIYAPPASVADFATYARAVAQRYGANGTFWQAHPAVPYKPVREWEIWNEENEGSVYIDPGRYADLYMAARSAIKSVDPAAVVVTGGLAPAGGITYLQQMFAARPGLVGQVDAFAWHPYGNDDAGTLANVASFRHALGALGEGSAPLELTELGWGTAWLYNMVPDATRAKYYDNVTKTVALSNCGVTRFVPFTWTDGLLDGGFGIYNSDATPTLAGRAYTNAVLGLEQGATATSTTALC